MNDNEKQMVPVPRKNGRKGKLDFGLVSNVKCFHCDNLVTHIFQSFVGKKECMCESCIEVFRRIEEKEGEDFVDIESEKIAADNKVKNLKNRCLRSGMPASVAVAIGLGPDDQDPKLPGDSALCQATRTFIGAEKRGLLCLSGHNGSGKTVCSAWASYRSRGRFIHRSEWSMIPATEDGRDRINEIINLPGIVTLDEVLSLSSVGDSDGSVRTVLMISCERSDKMLGTIITTRCTDKKHFDSVFGNDMLDRMLHHRDLGGSGWVTSADDVSMRATGG